MIYRVTIIPHVPRPADWPDAAWEGEAASSDHAVWLASRALAAHNLDLAGTILLVSERESAHASVTTIPQNN